MPLASGIGKLEGVTITPLKISATAPNYTAPCLKLKEAGVDSLYVADNGPIVQRVVAGCAQQGFHPLPVSQTSTSTNAWLTDTNFRGALLAATNANTFDTSLPVVKELQAAMEASYPGITKSSEYAFDAIYTWSGVKLFEAAAKAGDISPASTGTDVKKGLYALKHETLGGLSEPLTFTPGKPTFSTCWFTDAIKGGKFVSLNADKPTCLTATQAAALAQALKAG